MKVYSIGRELGCDIVINDNTDVISRRHAVLNVMPTGKMTIVDQSHNGTYVNGIRIAPNVPVPVTRKDTVSFAHIARLDWNLVPNPMASLMKWAAAAVVALLVVLGCLWGVSDCSGSGSSAPEGGGAASAAVDTVKQKKDKEEMEKREKLMQDSIKKHVQDSLKKARQNTDGKKAVGKDKGKDKDDKADKAKKPAGGKPAAQDTAAVKATRLRG